MEEASGESNTSKCNRLSDCRKTQQHTTKTDTPIILPSRTLLSSLLTMACLDAGRVSPSIHHKAILLPAYISHFTKSPKASMKIKNGTTNIFAHRRTAVHPLSQMPIRRIKRLIISSDPPAGTFGETEGATGAMNYQQRGVKKRKEGQKGNKYGL